MTCPRGWHGLHKAQRGRASGDLPEEATSPELSDGQTPLPSSPSRSSTSREAPLAGGCWPHLPHLHTRKRPAHLSGSKRHIVTSVHNNACQNHTGNTSSLSTEESTKQYRPSAHHLKNATECPQTASGGHDHLPRTEPGGTTPRPRGRATPGALALCGLALSPE